MAAENLDLHRAQNVLHSLPEALKQTNKLYSPHSLLESPGVVLGTSVHKIAMAATVYSELQAWHMALIYHFVKTKIGTV